MHDDGRMPATSDNMDNLDRPATHRDLRTELATVAGALRAELATKTELRATRDDLRGEIQAAKEELRNEMSTGFAELRGYIEFSVGSLRDELRAHFDLTAEGFRSEFRNLYNWTCATTTSFATRVEALEKRDAPPPGSDRHA